MLLYCAWGKDNEDRAQSGYKQECHERGHSSLEVTMLGLVINPEYFWLGASPDGVVHDPGCTDPNGLLEVMCPYDSTPFQATSQKGFCCRLEKGKRTTPLLLSCQGQMAIYLL